MIPEDTAIFEMEHGMEILDNHISHLSYIPRAKMKCSSNRGGNMLLSAKDSVEDV